MKPLSTKGQLIAYAFGAMGVNLLNIIVGSYLCSALIADGFGKDALANQTYVGINIIIPAMWAVFGVIAKVIDGLIDIPMAQFTDRLKSRWGRRRPAIVLGMIPMIASYCCFLLIPNPGGETVLNTVYYFIMLIIFYCSYTLTMVTYYATFTEIVDNEKDRRFLTNTKSIADIVYFIIGFALVPMILKGLNIRIVALIVLPLVLLMLIPLFLIKEKSTKEGVTGEVSKPVNIVKSLVYTFKNKDFIIWMIVYSFMTFGLQLFLSGINEYFTILSDSNSIMYMVVTMAATFAPVPFTFIIYNKLINKKGFKFAFQYTLLIYVIAMSSMFGVAFIENEATKLILSIVGGVVASFSVGAMFAVAYSIPAQLASDDEKKTGVSHSAMYFAIQGLFSALASGLGGTAVLTILKTNTLFGLTGTYFIVIFSAIGCFIAFILAFFLPPSIKELGKEKKEEKVTDGEQERN
ncbi:MAG: MFS transporter [Bacilli bacterium]|nr:MFS transporter [Bacilli bacterium]